MKKFILLNKKEGETPLECLGRFRARQKKYKDIKMTYAGRLDPMASGLLLVLAGEEVKNKEEYLKLSKEYELQILFGFATDTYDILGKVLHSYILKNVGISEKIIKQNLKFFTGKFKQKYPAYSSKTWETAKTGVDFEREEREIVVKSLKFLKMRTVSANNLLKNINKRIAKVKGDFRQKEILKIWQKNLGKSKEKFCVASFHIKCGSGTYVRAIANDLGERMGIPALALTIKRTKIGRFKL